MNYFEVFCQLNGLEQRCQAPWVTRWPHLEANCWILILCLDVWKGIKWSDMFSCCDRLTDWHETSIIFNLVFCVFFSSNFRGIDSNELYQPPVVVDFQRFPFKIFHLLPTWGHFSGRCDKTSYGSMVAGTKWSKPAGVSFVSRMQRSSWKNIW